MLGKKFYLHLELAPDMAALPLKVSRNAQRFFIRFRWAKKLSTNAIQQYMFGVKSLLMVEKVLLMRKNLVAVLFRRPMQRS